MSVHTDWQAWQAAGNAALLFESVVLGAFALLITLEAAYSRVAGRGLYHAAETRLNGVMYFGFFAINLFWAYAIYWAYSLAYAYRVADLGLMLGSLLAVLVLWLLDDLVFYTFHRASHRVRLLWTSHITHHTSRHFNLSAAFRQSWIPFYALPFWMLLPWLGFEPLLVMFVTMVNLFWQAVLHTQVVPKLGPIEWVFNTPSHHRVHHGANTPYLDRNFGGVLIIWDRLFGTYQPEDGQIPVQYGLTRNIQGFDPWVHAFSEVGQWLSEVWQSRSLREAMGRTFRPPGWQPTGATGQDTQRTPR